MFTPENFYETFFRNRLTSPQDVCYVPQFNGAKTLNSFNPYGNEIDQSRFLLHPWIMYDQEPMADNIMQDLRSKLLQYSVPQHHSLIEDLSNACLIAFWLRTFSFPIWCHSQWRSKKIQSLADYAFIDCYYWYHAFIARDWFRHWQYYDSLLPRDRSDCTYRFVLYARDHTGSRAYRAKLVTDLSRFKDKVLYDWDESRNFGPEWSARISIDDANLSAIHLVAETVFRDDGVYLTEKIFKPMVMGQPFLVFGPPGTLQYLHRYGFQSFGHVWDESYDLEIDHDRRMIKLVDVINRLADLDQAQYRALYHQCLPVIEHNRKRFFSDGFMQFCWQELTDNVARALDRRSELEKVYSGGQLCFLYHDQKQLCEIPMTHAVLKNALATLPRARLYRVLDQYPEFIGL